MCVCECVCSRAHTCTHPPTLTRARAQVHTFRFNGHSPADPEHERGRKQEKKWARDNADPIAIYEQDLLEKGIATQVRMCVCVCADAYMYACMCASYRLVGPPFTWGWGRLCRTVLVRARTDAYTRGGVGEGRKEERGRETGRQAGARRELGRSYEGEDMKEKRYEGEEM